MENDETEVVSFAKSGIPPASVSLHPVLFALFFLSGFCGLLYQIVWTRLAFAAFGVNTPVLSVVISAFMLGLALGSWIGGRMIGKLTARSGCSAATFYALLEFGIGLGAFLVPQCFALGDHWLLRTGETNSTTYLLLSAVVIALSLLPWCMCMGATFPFMMAYLRDRDPAASPSSFSFLYLANVIGAAAGTLLTAVVLIELLGFHNTLLAGALANFAVAGIATWLGVRSATPATAAAVTQPSNTSFAPHDRAPWLGALLFMTGFVSMAMEVVWIRAFTPYLKTQVYSFAMVLFVYLLATCIGSALYRRHLRRSCCWSVGAAVGFIIAAALLPLVASDPRWLVGTPDRDDIALGDAMKLLASICPFCFLLGYLSPRLIDDYAQGHPREAGRAYGLNVLGCILGPLLASYVLLPYMDVRVALVALSFPLSVFWVKYFRSLDVQRRYVVGVLAGLAGGLLLFALIYTKSFEDTMRRYHPTTAEVRRDYAATTISLGEGTNKVLWVNGIGMTKLTTITKCMAHLPLAFHAGKAESVLVICFGMGTSYRSALSWNVQTTAVELVPGVKNAFGYYHSDAIFWANHPKGRVVVDDGRRYMKRTTQKYDVILVDPPPPIEAAGSSLLYSQEFYALAKQRLKPGGILQAWFPCGTTVVLANAVARSLYDSFPHVIMLPSIEGWGAHFLA